MIFSTLCLFLTLFVSVTPNMKVLPLGLRNSKAPLYDPRKDFTCIDGSLTVPFKYVNDDYCDCNDGSDEPGTAACRNGSFYCENKGYLPEQIPASGVNDGFCDCCDGSDEYATKICEDKCYLAGTLALIEAVKQQEIVTQGHILRIQLCSSGKLIRQERKRQLSVLEKRKIEAEKLKNEAEEIKKIAEERENAALQVYREMEEKVMGEVDGNKEVHDEEAEAVFRELDLNSDSKLQEAELFEKVKSTGASTDRDDNSIQEEVKFMMKSKEEITLEEFVDIVWPRLKPIYMMEKGIYIPPEEQQVSTDAPADEEAPDTDEPEEEEEEEEGEVEGETLNEDDFNKDKEVEKNIEDNQETKYDEATRAIINEMVKAREHFEETEKALNKINSDINQLKQFLEKDYGPDDVYTLLEGQCFTYKDREYTYRHCPFDQVVQIDNNKGTETKLGNWRGWAPDSNHSVMLYEGGQHCWDGPQRSVKVYLSCGVVNEIFGASEPNKCEYILLHKTPGACIIKSIIPQLFPHDEL